jgi:DNA-binding GntR family transcriptional regulator
MAFVHQSLTDRIYDHIREGIVTNTLKPGTRLEELEIANSLDVSRTPVREALGRLGADGLVTIMPRRGAIVVTLTDKDIEDMYQVREALEILSLQLGAPRLTPSDLADLQRLHVEFKKSLDQGEYQACCGRDREFHDRLIILSGNNKLKELYDRLGATIQVTRWMHCNDHVHQERAYVHHSGIIEALQSGDSDLACARLAEHIRNVKADLLRSMSA